MLRLWNLFTRGDWHLHEWEILKESPYNNIKSRLDGTEYYNERGTQYTLRCKHCGNMKTFQTKQKM